MSGTSTQSVFGASCGTFLERLVLAISLEESVVKSRFWRLSLGNQL